MKAATMEAAAVKTGAAGKTAVAAATMATTAVATAAAADEFRVGVLAHAHVERHDAGVALQRVPNRTLHGCVTAVVQPKLDWSIRACRTD
jgi:hypothetical protein